MINSNLGIGPMSPEIIEAVYRYSNYMRKPLMLIASKNQIDHSGGYVNKWTTKEYSEFLRTMKEKYPQSSVTICRDHCGPGFNGNHDLDDVYKTIKADVENGFDLIHIDFCHMKSERNYVLDEAKKAIEYCISLNPQIKLEIGTDENMATHYSLANLNEIENEIDFFTTFCKPEFFVVQTGSLVKEIDKVGNFNKDFVKEISDKLEKKGIKLKEHNADYLTKEEISERNGIVGAMNIAPQLGVVQTKTVLERCLIYGIKFNDFIEEVYQGKKWKKWLHNNTEENKFLCAIISGHYHFSSDVYKKIIAELSKCEDIHETIINNIMSVIDHYQRAQNGI